MNINRQSGVLMLVPSVVLAIAIVFGLLLLMQFLITQNLPEPEENTGPQIADIFQEIEEIEDQVKEREIDEIDALEDPPPDICLLYTSPSPRDATLSRMPSSA